MSARSTSAPRDAVVQAAATDGGSGPHPREPRDLRDLFLSHHDAVARLLRRLGVGDAQLDDCVQEVFWVAARRFADIAPGRHRAFLYGVALRVAAAERRRWRGRVVSLSPDLPEPIDPSPSPEQQLSSQQARVLLDRVLADMPEQDREVLVLFELESLRVQDIAQIFDLPVGTASSRLRRARASFSAAATRLRAQLARTEGGAS